MTERLRLSELVIFVSWVVIAVTGAGFAKLTEDPPLSLLRGAPFATALSFYAVLLAGALSVIAVLVAGLPVASAIALDALHRRRWSQLGLLVLPAIALVAWVTLTLFIKDLGEPGDGPLRVVAFVLWVSAGLLAVSASCAALWRATINSQVDVRLFQRAILPTRFTVLAMIGFTLAIVAWGALTLIAEPNAFWSNNGMLATSTAANWLVLVVVSVGASLVALKALGGLRPDLIRHNRQAHHPATINA